MLKGSCVDTSIDVVSSWSNACLRRKNVSASSLSLSFFGVGQISKIYGAISEQLFKASGKRKDSREAKAAIAAVSKALTKMEDPKGSGLLHTGDLKKLVSNIAC